MRNIIIIGFVLLTAISCFAQRRYYHETGGVSLRVDEAYPGAFVEHRYVATGADNLFRGFLAFGDDGRGYAYGSAHEYEPLFSGTFELAETLQIFETFVATIDSDSTGVPIDSTLDSVLVHSESRMAYKDGNLGIMIYQWVAADYDSGTDIAVQFAIENIGSSALTGFKAIFFYDGDVPDYSYFDDYPVGIPYLGAVAIEDGPTGLKSGFCAITPHDITSLGCWRDWVDTLSTVSDTANIRTLVFDTPGWSPDVGIAADWSVFVKWELPDLAQGAIETLAISFLVSDSANFDDLAATVRGDSIIPGIAETRTPEDLQLSISPNPFNSTCKIEFENLKSEGSLQIYDLSGRCVCREKIAASRNSFQWNARTDRGEPIHSGVYLIKIISGKSRASAKAIYLK